MDHADLVLRLDREFYSRCTIDVARDLLGCELVRRLPNGDVLRDRITETEAYLGLEDPACHSFGPRRTARTEVMFGEAGHAYVYFIYGRYFCFNVVTMGVEVPEAVLIRSLANTRGPGKLCDVMQIDRSLNGADLVNGTEIWIERPTQLETVAIVEGPRVGLSDRYDAIHWPLRFQRP